MITKQLYSQKDLDAYRLYCVTCEAKGLEPMSILEYMKARKLTLKDYGY